MADAGARRGRADDAGDADQQHHAARTQAAGTLTYDEALAYITALGRFGKKLGPVRTREILERLGSPDRSLRGALVAGTNGKGSTCAMLAAILHAAGNSVGLMPKPHLTSYRERIQIDSTPISEADFTVALEQLQPLLEDIPGNPTEFEILTGLALSYLAPRVDRLVCEVGMGGRLDATNALDLGVAIVTNVSLDHTRHLGGTVEAIAGEKAAIIKPGDTAITGCEGPALGVVEQMAAAVGAPLWRLGYELQLRARPLGWEGFSIDVSGPGFDHHGLELPLLGLFQPPNAALAVAAAAALGSGPTAEVTEGLRSTRWPGRLEVVMEEPRVLVDGGHNPAAIEQLVASVKALLAGERPVVVFGAMIDKDLDSMLASLHSLEPRGLVFTVATSAEKRAKDPAELLRLYGGGEPITPSSAAVERARELAGKQGSVLVCGSIYLAGEVRQYLLPTAAVTP
jgi:dihydrofolate synthase/folylpolyglutamate synthase